ncbi:hypothetical protein B0H14DRAFT_3877753 [Mycena olivaceomarginata]|nr:hypothetical protein B0H14DRAFT_3877753 [Mycena olivaceomarginata]
MESGVARLLLVLTNSSSSAASHSSPRRRQRRACLLLIALASGLFLLIGSSYVYFAPSAPPQLRPLHQRPLDGHRGPAPAPLPPPHGHGENAPHPPTHGDGIPAPSSHGVAALTIRAGRGHKPEKGATYFDEDWDNTINKAGLFPDTSIHLHLSMAPVLSEVFLTQYPSYIDPYDYPICATTSINNIVNKYEPERRVPPSPPTYASPLCLEHRQRRTSLVDHTGRMPIEDLGPGPLLPSTPCAASTVAYAHPGARAPPTACATPCQSRPAALPPDHTPDSYLNDAAHWPTPTASSIPTTEAHPSASLSLSQSHLPLVRHLPLHPPPHAPMSRPRAHDRVLMRVRLHTGEREAGKRRRTLALLLHNEGQWGRLHHRPHADTPGSLVHVPAALPPILAAPPMRASPLAVFAPRRRYLRSLRVAARMPAPWCCLFTSQRAPYLRALVPRAVSTTPGTTTPGCPARWYAILHCCSRSPCSQYRALHPGIARLRPRYAVGTIRLHTSSSPHSARLLPAAAAAYTLCRMQFSPSCRCYPRALSGLAAPLAACHRLRICTRVHSPASLLCSARRTLAHRGLGRRIMPAGQLATGVAMPAACLHRKGLLTIAMACT